MARRKFNLSWKQGLAEVLLIFIGITLAIAFQNFNDSRKDQALKQGYYNRLLAELRQDASDLDDISKYNGEREKSIQKFFAYLDSPKNLNPDSVQRMVQNTSYHMSRYVPNENTYKELISTGNIKLIPTEIREKLLRLAQMHEYVMRVEESFNLRYSNRRDQMAEVIDEASFYGQRKNSSPKLLRWQRDIHSEGFLRFSNLAAARLTIAETLIQLYAVLKDQCEELISLVDSEVQN